MTYEEPAYHGGFVIVCFSEMEKPNYISFG